MYKNDIKEMIALERFDLYEYRLIILKRKLTIIAFALPLVAFVAAYSFLAKPIYIAKGTLLIAKQPNILNFEQAIQFESLNEEYYQTQHKLLKSRSLASATIKKLKLYENDGFVGTLKISSCETNKSDSTFRNKLIDIILDRIEIRPVGQPGLVEVQFKDQDPKFATNTLNTLFDSFIEMNAQARYVTAES